MKIFIFACVVAVNITGLLFAQQDRFQLVIGRGYQQEMLVCDTDESRSALVARFGAGAARESSLPNGCSWKLVQFVPRARVAGSRVSLPAQRTSSDGRTRNVTIAGEFMSAWQYNGSPSSVYIFYPTDQMRIVTADGREPQAIQASFGSGSALNFNPAATKGAWGDDGGPAGAGGYESAPASITNAVERYERPETSVVETIDGV